MRNSIAKRVQTGAAVGLLLGGLMVRAEVIPVSPTDGVSFNTLTDTQLKVFAGETKEARMDILNHMDKNVRPHGWRRQRELKLVWKTTQGEKGPWRIRLATDAGFTSFRDMWLENEAKMQTEKTPGETVWSYRVPRANLEPGKTYWWDVWSSAACMNHECGSSYPDKCRCGRVRHGTVSKPASFTTVQNAPRWIAVEGRVKNIRDLGGWSAGNGMRVRMGMIYRGQGLNENSVDGTVKGRNRLMVEDVDYLTGTLGIRTDLDLRGRRETGGLDVSPLGPGVTFIKRFSPWYSGVFRDDKARKVTGENFRLFCDKANYPVYIHCIGGADRTGSLAYILNGVLGVAKEDLERDWESTFYPDIPGVRDPKDGRKTASFDKGFAQYGKPGDTLQRRIELFLLDCGVTEAEIAAFRALMLEPAP